MDNRSVWQLLGIGPTADTAVIRKAYAQRLKENRPEDDPEAFQRLVAARSLALALAKSQASSGATDACANADQSGPAGPAQARLASTSWHQSTPPPSPSCDTDALAARGLAPAAQSPWQLIAELRGLLEAFPDSGDPAKVEAICKALAGLSVRDRRALEPEVIQAVAARMRAFPATVLYAEPCRQLREFLLALDQEFDWGGSDRSIYEALPLRDADPFMALLGAAKTERLARHRMASEPESKSAPMPMPEADFRAAFARESSAAHSRYRKAMECGRWPSRWNAWALLLAPLWALKKRLPAAMLAASAAWAALANARALAPHLDTHVGLLVVIAASLLVLGVHVAMGRFADRLILRRGARSVAAADRSQLFHSGLRAQFILHRSHGSWIGAAAWLLVFAFASNAIAIIRDVVNPPVSGWEARLAEPVGTPTAESDLILQMIASLDHSPNPSRANRQIEARLAAVRQAYTGRGRATDYSAMLLDMEPRIHNDDWRKRIAQGAGFARLAKLANDWKGRQDRSKRGEQQLQEGNIDGAIATLTSVLQEDPKLVTAYVARGEAQAKKGDLDLAISDYGSAIAISPRHVRAYFDRAMSLASKGQTDAAIADYHKVIEISPANFAAHINRGNLYYAKDEVDRAIEDYSSAIQHNPKSTIAFCNRGNAQRHKGELERALSDFAAALALDASYAEAHVGRAAVHTARAQHADALADCDAAIRLKPTLASAHNCRAWARLAAGAAAQGLSDVEQALALSPNDAHALDTRAHIYEALGRREEAIVDFRRALSMSPRLEASRLGLKRLGAAP
jgi:tetratricopeptide (TPR) repeat protein